MIVHPPVQETGSIIIKGLDGPARFLGRVVDCRVQSTEALQSQGDERLGVSFRRDIGPAEDRVLRAELG